ncbi:MULTISPECIES: FAD-dependent monooxygenase [unclassified Streptomyces]|uniref:FAD-dependent monooxygenase n=1 Tax=unclassified Streptomyces TaxID=2593676 RepID=UPI001660CC14|nr:MULTISPECIES: FAD-dependent monooxygenase [unclassified Streptomyces]
MDATDVTDVTDVVVVGAGPTGLMLAAELCLGGARTTVVDERSGPTAESRASTLHARTMEILDSRGLLAALDGPPRETRGHFGGLPMDLTPPGPLGGPYPGQWKVSQTRTEELLGERAAALGADLRRRHRLLSLETHADGVAVRAEGPGGEPLLLRASYLVACDGEESTVRRLTGAAFPGRDAGRELLRADVTGVRIADRRFQRLERGLAIAATRNGTTRVMVHEFGRRAVPRDGGAPDFAEVARAWRRVTGEDISHGTPLWVNAFGDTDRQLARYRHGRVLFAGDAAHRQMPSGGQALNLGVQDAFNLGWKLAAVVRGGVGEDLLDTYHRERHAVGRRTLANIRAQTYLLLGGPEVEPARALLGELMSLEEVRGSLAGAISGVGIRYDTAEGRHPLLGRRLPDAALTGTEAGVDTDTGAGAGAGADAYADAGTGIGTGAGPARPASNRGTPRTTELLRSGRGVLLLLGADGAGALRETAAPWAGTGRITVVEARPRTGQDEELLGTEALLVRPDGYVAWAGARAEGLTEAFRRWFGTPTATPRTGSRTATPTAPDTSRRTS